MKQNEETIFPKTEAMGNENTDKEIKEKEKGQWKRVVIGGVGGILLGTGAMYAASANGDDDAMLYEMSARTTYSASTRATKSTTLKEPTEDVTQSAMEIELPEETIQAESVTDEMSFAEAFKIAREEVGAGGVFQWKDGIYSTFTENEWNNLSDDDKNTYIQRMKDVSYDQETELNDESHIIDEFDYIDETKQEDVTSEETSDSEDVTFVENGVLGVDDEVRFLGDDPSGELAEATVVDIEDDVINVDLSEHNVDDNTTEEVPLHDFNTDVEVGTDDMGNFVQGFTDDVIDQTMTVDDTSII